MEKRSKSKKKKSKSSKKSKSRSKHDSKKSKKSKKSKSSKRDKSSKKSSKRSSKASKRSKTPSRKSSKKERKAKFDDDARMEPIEENENLPHPEFKDEVRFSVVLIGDGGVGKTSILAQYVNGTFDDEYKPTIINDFQTKKIEKRYNFTVVSFS
jgi:DNA replication protein DnaC